MKGHNYRLYYQITCVQGARDKSVLRFYIYRDRQADEIWIFYIMSKRHVSRGPRIPI
jgi:hypothetical protein